MKTTTKIPEASDEFWLALRELLNDQPVSVVNSSNAGRWVRFNGLVGAGEPVPCELLWQLSTDIKAYTVNVDNPEHSDILRKMKLAKVWLATPQP